MAERQPQTRTELIPLSERRKTFLKNFGLGHSSEAIREIMGISIPTYSQYRRTIFDEYAFGHASFEVLAVDLLKKIYKAERLTPITLPEGFNPSSLKTSEIEIYRTLLRGQNFAKISHDVGLTITNIAKVLDNFYAKFGVHNPVATGILIEKVTGQELTEIWPELQIAQD